MKFLLRLLRPISYITRAGAAWILGPDQVDEVQTRFYSVDGRHLTGLFH